MQTIDDLGPDLAGRRVLVRSDLNVPFDKSGSGVITDDGRIRASLPVIRKLAERGARVVVLAHLGRPKGADFAERAAGGPTLRPVAERLSELLGQPVAFAADLVGPSATATVAALSDGEVALLENVRFEPAETSKDDGERTVLAAELARLGDLYVGDGFGVVHRKQASVYDLPALLPNAAGDLITAEVSVLRRLTQSPARPYVVVLGGAKVSDKLGVIGNLLELADRVLIGGGMAYTFLAALGHPVGSSLLEADQIDSCNAILARAQVEGVELVLPTDIVVAPRFAPDAPATVVPADAIPWRPDGPGHRAGVAGAVRVEAGRRADGLLERPDGRVRVPGLRGRHPGRRRGADQGRRADRGRRRRLGGGGALVRPGRGRLRAHLDRRRRVARVPGRQDAPRIDGPGGVSSLPL